MGSKAIFGFEAGQTYVEKVEMFDQSEADGGARPFWRIAHPDMRDEDAPGTETGKVRIVIHEVVPMHDGRNGAVRFERTIFAPDDKITSRVHRIQSARGLRQHIAGRRYTLEEPITSAKLLQAMVTPVPGQPMVPLRAIPPWVLRRAIEDGPVSDAFATRILAFLTEEGDD